MNDDKLLRFKGFCEKIRYFVIIFYKLLHKYHINYPLFYALFCTKSDIKNKLINLIKYNYLWAKFLI
jgi:hypothetical protein